MTDLKVVFLSRVSTVYLRMAPDYLKRLYLLLFLSCVYVCVCVFVFIQLSLRINSFSPRDPVVSCVGRGRDRDLDEG